MSFSKILNHPSADLIVRRLRSGEGVRKVAKMLKEMYPGDKKLHITMVTLQAFRKEYLNIEGDALDIIKKITKEKKIVRAEKKEKRDELAQVKKLPSYKEKLNEAIDLHIDVRQQLASLHTLIMSRTEDLFDKLAIGEGTVSDEQNLQKYFQTYIVVLEKWAKFVDRIADYTVEANINVTVIEDQMSLLRNTVWEIMKEMEPVLAMKFLERLDEKMKNFNYRPEKKLSLKDMNTDIKVLTAKVEEIGD